MKFFFLLWIFPLQMVYAQEEEIITGDQLEQLAALEESETEDDGFLLTLEHFKKQPLNLNTADESELKGLVFLTELHIANLVSYRKLLGKFISLYELQSIPGWDISTIRKSIPFITIAEPINARQTFGERLKTGEHSILVRVSQLLEKSKGFKSTETSSSYQGSPQKVFIRYRYNHKNLLQYGITAEKDAGEKLFGAVQKTGFDFYSIHFFARKIGAVQQLAIGDYTVNMGQGLIQWQGLTFKKNAETILIKRQGPILQPYSSAGEFYFFRGAGITIKRKTLQGTAFISLRKMSANVGLDTVGRKSVSSFLSSGYHRTMGEMNDKNRVRQISVGGSVVYSKKKFRAGMNTIYHGYDIPVEKREEPYNLYSIKGNRWFNASVDYSYTHKNSHFFGEAAIDRNLQSAFINSVMISVDQGVDLSLSFRSIASSYQSVYGNAFTESRLPGNETGLYAGLTVRPRSGWKIDLYADHFYFPWLRYQVDAPSRGADYLIRIVWTPNKRAELTSRFRYEQKQTNTAENISATNELVRCPRKTWQLQLQYKLSSSSIFKTRVDMIWSDPGSGIVEEGWLWFADLQSKPTGKNYGFRIRVQSFETSGYNTRLYAYENDVPFSFSVPASFNKGFRYYGVINYEGLPGFDCSLRWSQTIFSRDQQSIGSGLDEISGNVQSAWKLQVHYRF